MTQLDDATLSYYLDGELEYNQACEVNDVLDRDYISRDKLLELLKVHVLLKTLGRQELGKKTQSNRVDITRGKSSNKGTIHYLRPLINAGVAVLLVIMGFSGARLISEPGDSPHLFPTLPASIAAPLNEVLENGPSGTGMIHVDAKRSIDARITPVKTFRDNEGNFHRLFSIDLNQQGMILNVTGVAMRKGPSDWQAKSVFFREKKSQSI